jgi:PAS domain S-box-containing protein
MHLYFLLPLASCIVCATTALTIWMRFPKERTARIGALLYAAPAAWALGEVGVLLAPDPRLCAAFFYVFAPGWILLPPLIYHLVIAVVEPPSGPRARFIPVVYVLGGILYLSQLGDAWLVTSVSATPWGVHTTFGPGYAAFAVYTGFCGFGGARLGLRMLRQAPSFAETRVNGLMAVGIGLPTAAVGLTEFVLPMLHVPFPRLGTTSFGISAALILVAYRRAGYAVTSPAVFSREILGVMQDGVAWIALDGRIRLPNDALARLAGVSREALEGRSFVDLVRKADLLSGAGEVPEGSEAGLIRADGRSVPVSVLTSPFVDRRGERLGDVVVVHDLREVVALRNRLLLAARMSAVGELAAGIAHEINNPLAFVRSNLGLLQEHWRRISKEQGLDATDHPLRELIEEGDELLIESLEGIDRAAAIVRDVRELSHGDASNRQLVDLRELLDRVVRVAAPHVDGRIRIEKAFGAPSQVLVSPLRMGQVFLNLLVNAIQAVGEAGVIAIETAREEDRVVVRVRDDGCGIPVEDQPRIFDPFFTTRSMGEGNGLGLSLSYEIVRSEGGELSVASAPGEGTTMTVSLPAPDDAEPA